MDSFNPERAPLGRPGISHLLSRRFPNAETVVQTLNNGETQHRGSAVPHDDLTVLVFGFK